MIYLLWYGLVALVVVTLLIFGNYVLPVTKEDKLPLSVILCMAVFWPWWLVVNLIAVLMGGSL